MNITTTSTPCRDLFSPGAMASKAKWLTHSARYFFHDTCAYGAAPTFDSFIGAIIAATGEEWFDYLSEMISMSQLDEVASEPLPTDMWPILAATFGWDERLKDESAWPFLVSDNGPASYIVLNPARPHSSYLAFLISEANRHETQALRTTP